MTKNPQKPCTRLIFRKRNRARRQIRGDVEIEYIKSEDNLADFFTKILPLAAYRKLCDLIMG